MGKAILVAIGIGLFGGVSLADTPAPVEPVRVCEILSDLAALRGKTVAVIGRYSFRENGRYLSEESCNSKLTTGAFTWPASLRLEPDPEGAPKLPDRFDIDSASAVRKLRDLRKTTSLGKFRFGSLEYDRWAIVYARVETSAAYDAPPADLKPGRGGLEPAPLRLVYRGDGLIFFIATE